MHEMRVCGDGINLTAYAFEALVFVSKILELCGTYEGEISGLEEKYAPFTENILLGYRFEIILVKRVSLEVCNLLTNH